VHKPTKKRILLNLFTRECFGGSEFTLPGRESYCMYGTGSLEDLVSNMENISLNKSMNEFAVMLYLHVE